MKQETTLNQNEWDFTSLFHRSPLPTQRWELRAATVYEYARESASIRKLAATYAEMPRHVRDASTSCAHPNVSNGLSEFTVLAFCELILWPRVFPKIAWLAIPAKERKKRVDDYMQACEQTVFEAKELDDLKHWERPYSPKTGKRHFTSKKEHLLHCLNWAFSNDEIIKAISSWVRHSRPDTCPEPRTPADRDSVEQGRLKRLGIMRLLHSHPYARAAAIAGGIGIEMPSQSNALKARYQVKADLHSIFQQQMFTAQGVEPPVPLDESPLHWATHAEQQGSRPNSRSR